MRSQRWIYYTCVLLAIAIVLTGWILSLTDRLPEAVSKTVQQVSQTRDSITGSMDRAAGAKKTSTPSLVEQTQEFSEKIEKKDAISSQLIQSLKMNIEADQP